MFGNKLISRYENKCDKLIDNDDGTKLKLTLLSEEGRRWKRSRCGLRRRRPVTVTGSKDNDNGNNYTTATATATSATTYYKRLTIFSNLPTEELGAVTEDIRVETRRNRKYNNV